MGSDKNGATVSHKAMAVADMTAKERMSVLNRAYNAFLDENKFKPSDDPYLIIAALAREIQLLRERVTAMESAQCQTSTLI